MKALFRGTVFFAPLAAQQYRRQGRRDDLEALAYTWLYLLSGSLPWMFIRAETDDVRFRQVRDMKASRSMHDWFKGQPDAFQKFASHCDKLNYQDRPDYSLLHGFLAKLRETFELEDHDFEWESRSSVGRQGLQPRAAVCQPDDDAPLWPGSGLKR